MKEGRFIVWFEDIGKEDVPLVGGKNANLGELRSGVGVPTLPGFCITTFAYRHFIEHAGLRDFIEHVLGGLDVHDVRDLGKKGALIRKRISSARMSKELEGEIKKAYRILGRVIGDKNPYVAVRSSATAEDVETASFAGQQDTYLNVRGEKELIRKVKKCFASLFTNRAISYREDKGFDHFSVSLSIGVQKMGRSDIGSAGVMFTIDPDSGFENVVVINGSYGLGEYVVQGRVIPDEWVVFKPTKGILERVAGEKKIKLVRGRRGNVERKVSESERKRMCLSDRRVMELVEHAIRIERHYKRPMDIEWLFDGETKRVYIVQARPETVHSVKGGSVLDEYKLKSRSEVVLSGMAIGKKIGAGTANVLMSSRQIRKFRKGEVLVTKMTDPDWEPIMKIASAIVTDEGGRTAHAAIVSRELGIPCIIGTRHATRTLKTGEPVTVDCSTGKGRVFRGLLDFVVVKKSVGKIPETRTQVMVNIGEPEEAFGLSDLPVRGVGLAREEFIINSYVGVHPLQLIREGQESRYVNALASGIGKIAAAFWPREVIVRLSDFKSDEYANLKGGRDFEPDEDNPMIGWRGASRYYDREFSKAFELECRALKAVRDDMGLRNVIIMVPFCRTPEEGKRVMKKLGEFGLSRKKGCRFYVMAEVPSNIVLADRFARIFDGFSIGSNDLTQLALGIDRNSERLSHLFDERNEAVKRMISSLIKTAHKYKKKVGICGQAPSDYPEFAEFLVKEGIDSISVNPDVAVKTIFLVSRMERKLRRRK